MFTLCEVKDQVLIFAMLMIMKLTNKYININLTKNWI